MDIVPSEEFQVPLPGTRKQADGLTDEWVVRFTGQVDFSWKR